MRIEPVLDKYGVEYHPDRDGNQKVRCPFHDDSHASASVHLGQGLYKCHGCGVSGDAIALLMNQEGVDFREAKRMAEDLADGDGGEVQRQPGPRDSGLPRRSGHRPGRRQWVSPWARSRP